MIQTPSSWRRSSRAFTITELLVVIVIFVLIIGIAIPAFKSMIESSERADCREPASRRALVAQRRDPESVFRCRRGVLL